MFKKGLTILTACSLVAVGVAGLASCGNKTTSGPVKIVGLNEKGELDVKVDMPYVISVAIDESFNNGKITWTSNATSSVSIVGDNTAAEITALKEGAFVITANLNFEGTVYGTSFTVNATRGVETFGLKVSNEDGKQTYKQGEAFSSDGLSVKKVKYVDGNETSVSTALTTSDYTLSIGNEPLTNGYIFNKVGTLEVKVTASDTALGTTTFSINVVSNPGFKLKEIFSNISENYNVYQFSNEGLNPYYTRTENYFFNWGTGTGFYLHDGVVRNLGVSQDESNNVVFSGGNKVCDGFYEDKSKHYAESLDYPMEAQGYLPFSKIEVSEEDALSMSVEGGDSAFTISSNLAIQLLDLVGYGFVAINYQVSAAQLIETTLGTEDGSTMPAYLYLVALSYKGQSAGSLAFCITEVDQANILELDTFVENPGTVSDTIDAGVQLVLDIVRGNNFKGLYSNLSENEYSTYAVDENSIQWFDRSDKYGDRSNGLIKIGEGYDVDAGVYQYTLVEGEVSPTLTNNVGTETFDYYRPSNWYGYSDGTGINPLDFSEMWILSEVDPGDQSKGYTPYIKYSLHNQGIAEGWSQQAWLYSEAYINKLESEIGCTFVGLSMSLVDTNYDGKYETVELGLDCTTSDFAGKASWDSMVLSSIGEYENEAVKNYLTSITPASETPETETTVE